MYFVSFFGAFQAKIEKNLPIFCNFFSLCINNLEESYKNNWSKDLTISENVVSLQRCLMINKTTNNSNNKKQKEK